MSQHPCRTCATPHEPRSCPATCRWCTLDLDGGVQHRNLNHGGKIDPTCEICQRAAQQPKPVNQPKKKAKAARQSPCTYLGQQIGDTDCSSCGGRRVTLKLFECSHPKQPLGAAVCARHGCGPTCSGYVAKIPPTQVQPEVRSSIPNDPVWPISPAKSENGVGVVLGSYKWPALIDLQIRVIRATCGPVPILVSDDCSPGFPNADRYARLQAICGFHPDVMLWPNSERIGHTGGDIAAYWKGVVWGASRGLQAVAKFSQRFIVTRTNWLQEGAMSLLNSGLPLASQKCIGTARFDLRTEAALLNVAQWYTPDVLDRIKPRRYWNDAVNGLSAETIIFRVLQDLLGGVYWPWNLFGPERRKDYPGVLWHNHATLAQYQALASQHGVTLDPDLHVEGWERDMVAGVYSYG